MEIWLKEFTQSFPELKKYCIGHGNPPEIFIDSPSELWLSMEDWFGLSIENEDYAMQRRIIDFLRLCLAGRFGDVSSPMQQAIFCGFLWWLGKRKEYWHLLPTWFTKDELERGLSENWFFLDDNERQEILVVLAG